MNEASKSPDDGLKNVDPLTARIFQAVRSAAALHRQMMLKRMATEGRHPGPGEVACLRMLAERDGISQRDLADRLHLSRPWITKMLQSLEKDGVVERRNDEHDQRLTRVYLTAAGHRQEEELRATWTDYLSQTVGALSEQDRRELERLLGLLNERLALLVSADEDAES